MTRSIDERIVQMQFDNQQFERGVSTSMRTLQQLKENLKLDNITASLKNLGRAGKEFSLQNMAASIESIQSRFSALGVIGMTVLQNLTNSAVNAGKQFIKSLTLDPVMAGFKEYETKMNAIKIMQANLGDKESLDQIKAALADLNDYADKTIYNFGQMTDAAGKFTAAGIDSKRATTAIKGLANVAAGGGVSAERLAGAYIQVSQALQRGSFMLQDWNSMDQAGLSSPALRENLMKNAEAMGINVDRTKVFRDTLKDGWLTTEVFVKTMEQAADATDDWGRRLTASATEVSTVTALLATMRESVGSGWAQTWEEILGDKQEATLLLTKVNDIFGAVVLASSKARNEMLSQWGDQGGRYAMIEALFNAFKGLQEILSPIAQAFRDIFPAMTAERLVKISEGLRDITRNFKVSDEASANLRKTFRGLFAILDIGIQAFAAIAKGLYSLTGITTPAGEALLFFTGKIGDLIYGLDLLIKKSGIFTVTISIITKVLTVAFVAIQRIAGLIATALGGIGTNIDLSGLQGYATKAVEILAPMKAFADTLQKGFAMVASVIKKVANVFKGLAQALYEGLTKAFSSDTVDMNQVLDVFNIGALAAVIIGLRKFIKAFGSIMKSGQTFMKSVTGVLDGVRGSLEAYQNNLKANMIFKIAAAIGILAAALYVLAGIQPEKLKVAMAGISVLFAELFGSVIGFSKIMSATGFVAVTQSTFAMISMSIAILLLSKAMTKMAALDWESIKKGGIALTILSAIIVGISRLMDKNSKGMVKSAFSFGLFAFSLGTLTRSLKSLSIVVEQLGSMETGKLKKGLLAIGVLLGQVLLFSKLSGMEKMNANQGLGMIGFAISLSLLAAAVAVFAEMDPGKIGKGLISIGALLTVVGGFMKLTANSRTTIGNSIGLTIMAQSLFVFAAAIVAMAIIPWPVIVKGLITIAATLVTIATALNMLPKDMLVSAMGVAVVAGALVILAEALQEMAEMSLWEIAKSLIALAGSLVIISMAMKTMTTSIKGVGSLMLLTVALNMLIPTLIILGNVPLSVIGVGLLGIAGIFGVLALAGRLLTPVSPTIILLSGAIVLLGVGCAAAGLGLMLFATGLATLAVSGAAGMTALTTVITGIVSLIPLLVSILAVAILDFIKVIGDGIPVIVRTVTKLLRGICDVIIDFTPKIIDTLLKIIPQFLTFVVRLIPIVMDAGVKMIMAFMKAIISHIDDVAGTAITLVLKFAKVILSKIPVIVDVALKLIIAFINGLAEAIRKNHNALFDAVGNLITAIAEAIGDLLPKVVEVGGQIVTSLVKGLGGAVGNFVNAGKNVVIGFVNGVKDKLGLGKKVGTELGKEVSDATKKELDINSPSGEYQDIGMYSVDGFVKGMKDSTPKAVAASKDMANQVLGAAEKTFNLNPASKGGYQTYGSSIVDELIAGMKKNTPKVTAQAKETSKQVSKASKDSIKSTKAWISQQKSMHAITLTEEMNAWLKIQNDYKKGTDERKQIDSQIAYLRDQIRKKDKTADDKASSEKKSRLSKEQQAAQKAYDADIARIEDKKYYNQLSLIAELNAWKSLQKKYKEGSEERKKIDKEVYRVNKELAQKAIDDQKKVFDTKVDTIEDKKYFGKMDPVQELAEWNKILKETAKTAEEREQAKKEIYRLQLQVNQDKKDATQKAYEDDRQKYIEDKKNLEQLSMGEELATLEALREKYKSNAEIRKQLDLDIYQSKQNITNSLKELDNSYYSNCQQVNDKLKSDIQSVTDEYNNALKSRTDALYSATGLFDKVSPRDPVSGTGLMTNLKGQVKEFEVWQKTLAELGKKGIDEGLMAEFRQMGPKTLAEIQALNTLSEKDLTTYVGLWKTKYADARTQALLELEPMKTETSTKITELKTQAEIDLKAYKQVWIDATKQISAGVNDEINLLLTWIPSDVENAKPAINTAFDALGKTIKGIFTASKWNGTGANMVLGMISGVKSMATKLADAASKAAAQALAAAKKRLGIKSPSREFAKVGMYSILGMVDGLSSYSGLVADAGTNTGNVAVDSLKTAVRNISDVVNSNMDTTPTIRPVLDMTDIENGMASTFGETQTLNVAGVASRAKSIVRPGGTSGTDTVVSNQTDNSITAPVQIIYKPTVRNDADLNKIDRGLKNIVDRYAYARGVTVG